MVDRIRLSQLSNRVECEGYSNSIRFFLIRISNAFDSSPVEWRVDSTRLEVHSIRFDSTRDAFEVYSIQFEHRSTVFHSSAFSIETIWFEFWFIDQLNLNLLA
jgi:hypothetical protein